MIGKRPVFKVQIHLKSGQTITGKFYSFKTSRNVYGELTEVSWETAPGTNLLHLDVDQIAAVVYV